ncbi:MAG: LysM peptidoglycan-binding domain-containing protein [Lachnospiraceae bacterium]|nr:LysM peptidoglycan-binding domain-containing protein [Lachnospiraceae bacterium]
MDAADIGVAVPSGSVSTHTVKSGDTLSALAKKYGTTVDKIVSANKGKYPKMTKDYIIVGWVLTIPQ